MPDVAGMVSSGICMLNTYFLYILKMYFEWDDNKARENVTKHNVTFVEATTVWTDPLALIASDPDHSILEQREWIIGTSNLYRVLIVIYTVRDGNTRIISARKATKRERERYEEEGY